MRIIGIDFGLKRIGVAVSDEEGKFALPKTILSNSSAVAEEIIKIARNVGAKKIVLGKSEDFGGKENPLMEDVRVLQEKLENNSFEIFLEPEFFSSVEAGRYQGSRRNAPTDDSAAAIILQRFLDKLGGVGVK